MYFLTIGKSMFGDSRYIFMRFPKDEENIGTAEKEVEMLCIKRARELYEDKDFLLPRLEKEMCYLHNTKTSIIFLTLRVIVNSAKEKDYPVSVGSQLQSSLIAYLLGLTSVNPLPPHYYCEQCKKLTMANNSDTHFAVDLKDKLCDFCGDKMKKDGFGLSEMGFWQWAEYDVNNIPYFTIEAPTDFIEELEESLYAKLPWLTKAKTSVNRQYHKFILPYSKLCENLWDIQSKIKVTPTFNDYDSKVYKLVLAQISNELIAQNLEELEAGVIDLDEYKKARDFAQNIKEINVTDFYTLSRAFAYIHSNYIEEKDVGNILDTNYFVTKEELTGALIKCGIPETKAIELSEKGVRSTSERKKYYMEL